MTAERAHECRLQGVCMRSGRLSACASMLSACVTRGAEMAGALDPGGDGPKRTESQKQKSGPAVNVTVKKNRDNLRAPAFTHPVHLWGMRARHTRTESSLYLYVCPWKVGSQGGTQRRLTVVGAAWQPAKQPSSQMRGPATRGRYHSVTFVAARPCCRRSFDVASPSRCFLRACRRSSTA